MKQVSFFPLESKAKKEIFVASVVLIVLLVLSAISVVYSTYKSRQLFSALQQEYRKEVKLEEQWGRLLLEQSTWASHVRIEEIAISKLKMRVPGPADIKIIKSTN